MLSRSKVEDDTAIIHTQHKTCCLYAMIDCVVMCIQIYLYVHVYLNVKVGESKVVFVFKIFFLKKERPIPIPHF